MPAQPVACATTPSPNALRLPLFFITTASHIAGSADSDPRTRTSGGDIHPSLLRASNSNLKRSNAAVPSGRELPVPAGGSQKSARYCDLRR